MIRDMTKIDKSSRASVVPLGLFDDNASLPHAPRALVPPLKWHGGKSYLARRIVELMPPHKTYVEPFAGGLAVLLAKPADWRALEITGSEAGVSETTNDINGRLMSLWRVIRDPELFERFHRRMEATPHAEAEWRSAGEPSNDPVEDAARLMVLHRQSRGGGGRDYQTPSRRPRRGMNEHASAWLGAIEGLPALHDRLRRVQILNRRALDVIRQMDSSATLFYCDPPYHPSTRATPDAYAFEMTDRDHRELLAALRSIRGKVMLSGYRCPLYDHDLAEWNRHDFDLPNNAAGGRTKKRMIECLWCNF